MKANYCKIMRLVLVRWPRSLSVSYGQIKQPLLKIFIKQPHYHEREYTRNEVETSQDRWVRVISEWKTAAVQWEAEMRGQDEAGWFWLTAPTSWASVCRHTQHSWSQYKHQSQRQSFCWRVGITTTTFKHNKVGLTEYSNIFDKCFFSWSCFGHS